jgi:hypothetical protein
MKRGIKELNIIFIIFLIALAVFVNAQTGIDYNNDGTIDAEEQAKYYGENTAELLDKSEDEIINVLDNYPEEFAKGLSKASDENLEKFADLWFKVKEDGSSKINDEIKNKIFEKYPKEERKKFLIKLFEKKLFEKYPEDMFHDSSKIGIKNIGDIIDDEVKLTWVGNKLVVLGEDGEQKAWMDLDNIPRWATSFAFENGKFKLGFHLGDGRNKEITFDGGSIGSMYGELIGPDGKRIGTRMYENIKNIKYNDAEKKFTMDYEFLGKSNTLELGMDDLPDKVRERIQSVLNHPDMGEKVK